MVKFRGRSRLVQYNVNKPVKFGIKLWSLAACSTGYIINIEVFHGKSDDKLGAKSENIVKSLCSNLLSEKTYMIFMDRYFTEVKLFQFLHEVKGYDCIGMTNQRRKGIEATRNKNPNENEILSFEAGEYFLLKWKDKKILSTIKNNTEIKVNFLIRRK